MSTLTAAAPGLPEFDHELRLERVRRLRVRFVWYCAVLIVISVLLDLPSYIGVFRESGTRFTYHLINAAGTFLSIAAYLAALAYVWRAPPNETVLFRLVYRLYVLVTSAGLIYTRAAMQIQYEGDRDIGRDWLVLSVVGLFINYMLACVFMPWTRREAVLAVLPPLLVNAAIVAFDLDTETIRVRGFLLAILVSPLSAAPGVLICWLRFSDIREWAKLKIESTRYRQLQNELNAARRLHEACLPPQCHDGPVRLSYVYEPMRQIGGDLLFIHPRIPPRDAPLSAVILDVTGHGIAAALTVNRLVGELERLFAENADLSPVDLLRALNRYVCLTLASHGVYATALGLRIDPRHHRLEWASAGHPPAFLRRHGGTVDRLDSTAPLLGVLDCADYECDAPAPLPFDAGDTIVAYTDGAPESRNHADAQFGIDGIESLVAHLGSNGHAPVEWPDAVLRRVTAHRNAPAEDDTLLLTLHCPH